MKINIWEYSTKNCVRILREDLFFGVPADVVSSGRSAEWRDFFSVFSVSPLDYLVFLSLSVASRLSFIRCERTVGDHNSATLLLFFCPTCWLSAGEMSSDSAAESVMIARAMPTAPTSSLRDVAIDCVDKAAESAKKNSAVADALAETLQKLSVHSSGSSSTVTSKKPPRNADPADFVTLQSLRSSALARKTNTTSKFGRDGANLFADLLLVEKSQSTPPAEEPTTAAAVVAEKKTEEKNSESTESNSENQNPEELLARGPVRSARANPAFHPYVGAKPYPSSSDSYDNCHYDNYQRPWSANRELHSNSSSPDTINSDLGYSSTSTSPQRGSEFGALSPGKEEAELPDALSDFILKYSRSYRGPRIRDDSDDGDLKNIRPGSVESNVCSSPLSAGSAPQSSPAAPHGGMTGPSTPASEYRGKHNMGPLRSQLPSGQYTAYLGRKHGAAQWEQHSRPAKEVLRTLVRAEDMDEAWAWTCKCMQNYPGALCYQDDDRDTLLHIVTMHMDLGKIYALVEQMLKTEYPGHQKPFDMRNRFDETPLFLAVEKRRDEVVDYLLEAGANPNSQNNRAERDAPLHYAASRGMANIVSTICSYSSANLNLSNGMGSTAILCAVQNHGTFDEEANIIVDSVKTIEALLKYGADPLIPDGRNGRTVLHYAVDRLAPELIDVFKANMDEEVIARLANQPDNSGETPMENVKAITNADEDVTFKLCLSLIMCGALEKQPYE